MWELQRQGLRAGDSVLTALSDAVSVMRLHSFLLAAKQPTAAGHEPSSSSDAPAPAGHAVSLANGVSAASPRVSRLWCVHGTASVDLRSCCLDSAKLAVQPEREAAAAENAQHGAVGPPGPLLLSVQWQSGGHQADGAPSRCQLRSEPPLPAAYVRSLEAMADAGSEVRARPRHASR